MRWLGDVALNCVQLLGFQASGEAVYLRLQLLDYFVLFDDGLVERINQLFQVCQVGLDVDEPFIIRHEDRLHRTKQGIDYEGLAVFSVTF